MMLLATELRPATFLEYFKFLGNLVGRSIFNLFLSSISVTAVSRNTNEYAGFIYGTILFAIAFIYLCIFLIFGNKYNDRLN